MRLSGFFCLLLLLLVLSTHTHAHTFCVFNFHPAKPKNGRILVITGKPCVGGGGDLGPKYEKQWASKRGKYQMSIDLLWMMMADWLGLGLVGNIVASIARPKLISHISHRETCSPSSSSICSNRTCLTTTTRPRALAPSAGPLVECTQTPNASQSRLDPILSLIQQLW